MQAHFHVPEKWYETFFTAPVNRFWEMMVPPEATLSDCKFIRRHIGQEPPARVLDAPCGAGRHSLLLAEAGFLMTGVDISSDNIARASSAAKAAALPAQFVQGDMRKFAPSEPADAIICFGNSIGYFGADGMQELVASLARSVRIGGRLVIDTYTCAESIFPLQEEREIQFDGGSYDAELSYDPLESRLQTKAVLTLGDEKHELLYAHYVVTTGELVGRLREGGFSTLSMHADTEDAPYRPGSPRLLLVAQRD
jgi:SAM-dependent methyltransferase